MKKVVEEKDDVAFYLLMSPIVQLHPKAYDKSKTIMCAENNEEALKLLEDAYAGKELPAPGCEKDTVDENVGLMRKLGITGTPTLVFQDGQKISGAMSAEDLKKAIYEGQQ